MDHQPLQEALRPVIGFWIFSALIQTMPKPEAFMGNVFYTWLYNFLQALGANLSKIGQNKEHPEALGGKGNPQSLVDGH